MRKNAQGRERPAAITCPYVLKMCVWPLCLGDYHPDPECVIRNEQMDETEVVHGTGWCGQGDITIRCTNAMTEAGWGAAARLAPGVYRAENGQLYAFERAQVTCPECLHGR